MNIFKEFIIYLANKFQEQPSKEVEDLRKELREANALYYTSAEDNTKLRNKLSRLSFKTTWYERDHYPMPINRRLIVQGKDGKYYIGSTMKDTQGRTEFHIEYELTRVNPKLIGSVVLEFLGMSSWANQWKVFEFPEDVVAEIKKSAEDCKMRPK